MTGTRHPPVLQPDDRRDRRHRLSRPLLILVPLALAGTGIALAQEPVVLAKVDVHLVALGYRVSGFLGARVVTPQGDTVGRIDDFIIGDDKVLMTIISTGGFLGIGDRKVAIPYSSLNISPERIVLPGSDGGAVNRLPEFRYR
jgi:sporulation protein YlmC with PRC-barrel domain